MQGTESTATSKHVLIVDDDARLLHVIESRLHRVGYRCTIFSNVDEATACVSMKTPDLVISDLCMRGIDGAGLVGMLRSTTSVPILIITGDVDKAIKLALQYEGLSILRKPFNSADLLARVVNLLSDSYALCHDGQ